MADLYSKVTLRPRSKLERVLELLHGTTNVPKRQDSGLVVQLALYYLVAAEITPTEASALVKHWRGSGTSIDGSALLALEASALGAVCPARTAAELLEALHALGRLAQERLDELSRRDPDAVRQRLLSLPRLTPDHADLLLLSCGLLSTVAPSPSARRVASRLGYPGTSYAALSRALDAEIPEGDPSQIAWRAHHALAQHGRDVCLASAPACSRCAIQVACSYRGQGQDPAARLSNPGV